MAVDVFPLSPDDERRFNNLLSATYKKVYNMAYRLAGNRSDAEDLTQDAFCRAYRSFKDYEGDRPFENWILRIVTRLFLDLLRNRRRRINAVSYDAPLPNGGDNYLHFDMPDDASDPQQAMIEDTYSEDLQTALATLDPERRLLITLVDIEGVTYKEIAEMLDIPVGTVRSRLHRVHKVLRDRLTKTNTDTLKKDLTTATGKQSGSAWSETDTLRKAFGYLSAAQQKLIMLGHLRPIPPTALANTFDAELPDLIARFKHTRQLYVEAVQAIKAYPDRHQRVPTASAGLGLSPADVLRLKLLIGEQGSKPAQSAQPAQRRGELILA